MKQPSIDAVVQCPACMGSGREKTIVGDETGGWCLGCKGDGRFNLRFEGPDIDVYQAVPADIVFDTAILIILKNGAKPMNKATGAQLTTSGFWEIIDKTRN